MPRIASGIRLDYEPGFDGAPAFRRSTLTGAPHPAGPSRMRRQPPRPRRRPPRDAVESGRATDRRPYVDLGAAGPRRTVPASPAAATTRGPPASTPDATAIVSAPPRHRPGDLLAAGVGPDGRA